MSHALRIGWTVLATLMLVARPAAAQVVFHETFDHYGVAMPGVTDACVMAEYPPSLKYLEFRPEKPGSVYKGAFFPLPAGARGLTDYEFEFAFRFPRGGGGGGAAKGLDVRLDFLLDDKARQPKTANCGIRISPDVCGVTAVAGAQPRLPATRTQTKETPLHPLVGGYYYRGLVRVRGTRLEAFVDAMGRRVRIGAAEVGGQPLAGFNFSGAAAFDLDDVIVRKIAPLPAGDFREEASGVVANRYAEFKLPFPADANTATARVRLGNPGEMRIVLSHADGPAVSISVSTFGTTVTVPVMKERATLKDGKPVVETVQANEVRGLPDAGLKFREVRGRGDKGGLDVTCNVRPWVEGYTEDDRLGLAANWERHEAASAHVFKFEVRRDAAGIEYWIDGRYCGRRDSAAALTDVTFVLPPEAAVRDASATNVQRDPQFVPLDVAHVANPGVMASAKLPVDPGVRDVKGVPFVVAPGAGNFDLSVCRENMGSFALECDNYLSRSAFSGMPESFILSVPAAQYGKAYVLCAVADDPAREPVLTARLTRFLSPSTGGRGPAIADTTITLPRAGGGGGGDALPAGVTALGEVAYDGGRRAPLYLVEIPLDAGRIQDVIYQEKLFPLLGQPYLDFELLGKTDRPLQQLNKLHKPDPASKSAVHVFGVTLWRPPVEFEVVPARVGNAYYANERPAMDALLRAHAPGTCKLTWEARDVDGRVVDSGEASHAFKAAGEERKVTVTPKVDGVGHFQIAFRLGNAVPGGPYVEHRASFAIVAPDTRKAGYESPYFAWWFHGAHLTSSDYSVVGPLLKMAGVRRSHPKDEEVGKPWGLTTGQVGSFAGPVAPEQVDAKRAEWTAKVDAWVRRFPHADAANIFHESLNGGGQFPLELYGIHVPLPADPLRLAAQQNQVRGAVLAAQIFREKYPNIRPTLVNTGDSLSGAGMLMRHKIPGEALTALGDESLGQTMPPETSTAYGFWALRELGRKMGYGDVPVDACYEWKGRNMRDLGERRTAAWRVRDALIAHAWGCRMVPVPGIIEPGNSYHNTVWGDDWMFSRSPQMYPYANFSTVAHLTQVLDRAKFVRRVPTGSLSVYALEFARVEERVYALWTARGTADVSLAFDRAAAVHQSDMFGRTTERKASANAIGLTASGEPTYVVAPGPVSAITVRGRAYPDDQPPPTATVRVADAMARVADWELDGKPDDRLENVPAVGNKNYLPFRQLGRYELRSVNDDQKGACVELELRHDREVVPFLPEYAVLRLKAPAPIQGQPTTLGVWVKGDSNWAQLMWEFEDAQGERWLSCGTGGYGCDVYDWPRQASANFDGWNFVQFPITQASSVRLPNPGEVAEQWRSSGGGNGRIDYPVKLTGVAVSMTRQALDLTEMRPVKTAVRLKDLSAY
jgi:hypothetical protein